MISRADRWACDSSVAVASLDPNHAGHAACRRSLVARRPALAGHAAFQTFAVLTRLPPPLRLSPRQAAEVIARTFPEWCWPDRDAVERLRDELAEQSIAGGSVYDALVATAARSEQRILLTRDRRARRTYERLDVAFEYVE